MIKRILLGGIEYPFNEEKEEYVEGHVYCKECGEQLDNDTIELFGDRYVFRKKCFLLRKTYTITYIT